MNALALTISNTLIRQDASGRYCLNDLHKAAGNQNRHRPSLWLKNQQAIDLIEEIGRAGNPDLEQNQAVKVINGGNNQGTFVVKELVYAYAMWISAKFHIAVIRAYDGLVTEAKPQPYGVAFMALSEHADNLRHEVAGLKDELLSLYRHRTPVNEITVNKVPVEALVLMEQYGVPRDEIARVSGRSRNCVRQHIHNAKKVGGV